MTIVNSQSYPYPMGYRI